MTRFAELIERIAAAPAPDRELDAQIALACGLVPAGAFRPCGSPDRGTFGTGAFTFWTAPPFTADMNAASSLIPLGWQMRLEWRRPPQHSSAILTLLRGYDGGKLLRSDRDGSARHPALAICLVSLRAKEAALVVDAGR